jgi:hypothetical protein
MMSLTDPVYTASAAYQAGASVDDVISDSSVFPGFDDRGLLSSPDALLGRWVRSPSKFVGWDTYMEFFGLQGDKALQETEEPQEHVITAFSKEKLRIIHRLPWRDGLDCEYTVPLDGSVQPIPPAMVARASSSWKVNDLMSWVHTWDEGDGNPLHRGLRTEQKMRIGETDYTLRYWRSLIRPNEIRVNVEVTYSDTGKYAVHTQRFFTRINVDPVYSLACVTKMHLSQSVETWTHAGRAVRLVVLPHAANMPEGWEKLGAEERWNHADPFPSAGRSSGPFLTELRTEAAKARLWICCGLVFRATVEGQPHAISRGVALIGADGWLHGVHVDATPASSGYASECMFAAGSGEWPATQRPRPLGVYDTELGRIAVVASPPSDDTKAKLVGMGAELILAPLERLRKPMRMAISLPAPQKHLSYTGYELCGPLALNTDRSGANEFWCIYSGDDGEVAGGKMCSVMKSPTE